MVLSFMVTFLLGPRSVRADQRTPNDGRRAAKGACRSLLFGDRPARLGAASACLRACTAMVHVVARAFLAARLAKLGAEARDRHGVLAVARHHRCGEAAEVGAIDVERDAAGHRLHVVFEQAGGRATVAGIGAAITRLDGIAVGFRLHVRFSVVGLSMARQVAGPALTVGFVSAGVGSAEQKP
jgi:hypothetical protein